MTRNAQDIIDDMRNIVKPRIAKMLLETNFEGCGKEDKDEFETEFEMTLTLAEKALEQEPRWIPLTTRPMTEEETEHYFEYMDMRIDDTYTILDCPLPDDGQEVLVSWGGNVGNDVFVRDNEGCYFEGVDIDDVDAWMPLPEPYKAESEGV